MEGSGRHHALATPEDAEGFAAWLLNQYSTRTSYNYWRLVYQLYEWLRWHTDHPHVYTPVLMAAVEYSATAELWEFRYSYSSGGKNE